MVTAYIGGGSPPSARVDALQRLIISAYRLSSLCHDIDDRHADVVLSSVATLETTSRGYRSDPCSRADDFDGRHQSPMAPTA